jgi:hypothetical protein
MGSWKDIGASQGSPRSVSPPLLCKEGQREVERSTPPPHTMGRNIAAPLTKGRTLTGADTKAGRALFHCHSDGDKTWLERPADENIVLAKVIRYVVDFNIP